MSDFTWRDPKTDLTHAISSHSSPFDTDGRQSKRMKCGLEAIVEDGLVYMFGSVAVPWVHARDVVTCFMCVVKDRAAPWEIRGA